MTDDLKKLQAENEKHYNYIFARVNALIKSDKLKKRFFEKLNALIDTEIKLEKYCNE